MRDAEFLSFQNSHINSVAQATHALGDFANDSAASNRRNAGHVLHNEPARAHAFDYAEIFAEESGAGIIGEYKLCSFGAEGTGTFLGGAGTQPRAEGATAGELESVRECRLEMVCSRAGLAIAIETLRRFHPYEEPAIDVYDLRPQPLRSAGGGRRLALDKPVTVLELAQRLKTHIKRDRTRYALAWAGDPSRVVTRVGVVPGSGSELSRTARDEGCEVFVTGEMKHHEIMGALHAGMSVVLGGHTNTERGYLPRLAVRLRDAMPGITITISTTDKDPLEAA